MKADPRLVEIKDCLYRVAVKAVITDKRKILLVLDNRDTQFSFPGGGIDYGETAEQALYRELHEEIGLTAKDIFSVDLMTVVTGHQKGGIPRVNVFYTIDADTTKVKVTDEVSSFRWVSLPELKDLELDQSTGDISKLIPIIGSQLI